MDEKTWEKVVYHLALNIRKIEVCFGEGPSQHVLFSLITWCVKKIFPTL